jgi:acetylglutamate kinase
MANGFYIGGFLNQQPTTFIELSQNGQITITAPAGITINGNVNVNGDVTAGNISLTGHTHTDSVGGTTTPPI